MNLIEVNDPFRQDVRRWSAHLSKLAADVPAPTAEKALAPFDFASIPALPARLSSVLIRLSQRNRTREHAADKLRVQEFLVGS